MSDSQQFKTAGGKDDDDAADAGQVTSSPRTDTSDIDSVLDEIDGVLESNASEFVAGFVQKGGQ